MGRIGHVNTRQSPRIAGTEIYMRRLVCSYLRDVSFRVQGLVMDVTWRCSVVRSVSMTYKSSYIKIVLCMIMSGSS